MSLDRPKDVPVVSSGTAAESAAACSKASPTARPQSIAALSGHRICQSCSEAWDGKVQPDSTNVSKAIGST